MSTKQTPQERIARALCRLLDDNWSLGRKLYMGTAAEIMADIGYSEMLEALDAARPIISSLISNEYNVETWGVRGCLATIDRALAKAEA